MNADTHSRLPFPLRPNPGMSRYRSRCAWSRGMRLRSCYLGFPLLLLLAVAGLVIADEIHRNDFSGKATFFIKGDANIKIEEKAHDLSTDRSRSLPTSEHIRLNLAAGKNESNFAYYYYPTPAAPLAEDSNVELWVHSNRAGVKLLARLVFPHIRNPKQLDESLTRLVLLDEYKAPAGGWQKLVLKRPGDILKDQKQALRLETKGDPDVSDAYIDRLVLNLYTGPGEVDVYVDNLEIGPVKGPAPGIGPKLPPSKAAHERGVAVEFKRGKLTIGDNEVFPRFIRYSGTPMQALRDAGFMALSMPPDVPPELLEDAIDNYKFWIIPQLPPISEANPERPVNPLTARDPETLAAQIRKFQSGDGVLFWDLGPQRSEDYRRVSRTVEAIRSADPRRPIGADVWDGFSRFAIPLQLIGTHRDPLMTSLELDRYGQWLAQRQILAAGSKFTWTWIQTHIPDWQVRLLYDRPIGDKFPEPIGPQPEQIRLLTYLAIANGCKGLGFWSDRFLADSHQGRDRLLQLALLNQEIELLEPLLLNLTGEVRWINSSHSSVKVAILRTNGKGVLALPIWLGTGAQYVPPQGSVQGLTFTVPLVPDGAEPWEISPVRIQSLQNQIKLTPEGTQVTLADFDLTAAVAFTSDTAPDGLLAAWQKKVRNIGGLAAQWACDLAEQQLRKVVQTQKRLAESAPPIEDAPGWIREAEKHLMEANRARFANNDVGAYMEAIRAMRPMRQLMRAYWDQAVKGLDHPAATPYSVSFYTLPRHWELARIIRDSKLGENALPDGNFNSPHPDKAGVPVTVLPGWTVQEVAIDDVVMKARIVASAEAKETPADVKPPKQIYKPTALEKRVIDPLPRKPELGDGILRLSVMPKPVAVKKDEKAPPEPQALERVFLCVNSPPVRFPPGTWVRISGWVKISAAKRPGTEGANAITDGIRASADGAMFFDTTAGEAYAIRLVEATPWTEFHVYRKVPASGEVRVRLALTGFGTAYFDNIRVEPFLGSETKHIGEISVLPPLK
jgi:hypothetical protein